MGGWIWVTPGIPREKLPGLDDSDAVDVWQEVAIDVDETEATSDAPIEAAMAISSQGEPPNTSTHEGPQIRIKVLGSFEVDPELPAPKRSVVLELACFLALHPRRPVSTEELQIALSGADEDASETSAKSVRNYVSELRRWLGADHVPSARGSGYRLADSVTSDWAEFQSLVKRRSEDPDEEISALTEALNIVRGRPFNGTNYKWVDSELLVSEMEVAIGDVARRLGAIAAARGEPAFAFFAGRRAVLACPYDLGLWEMALEGAAGYDPDELTRTWHLARVTLGDDAAGLEDVARRLGLI
jgi:hypothetical protein